MKSKIWFVVTWHRSKCSASDGATVTWYEPTPSQTTSSSDDALIPGKLQVNEGSSATLNWNYSLTSTLGLVDIRFQDVFIVSVLSTGKAGPISGSFRQRFNVSSTPQSVSLLISKVTTADDMSKGNFSCELTDLSAGKWRREIQVQVIGKLKSFADFLEILTINNYNIISIFPPLGPVKV